MKVLTSQELEAVAGGQGKLGYLAQSAAQLAYSLNPNSKVTKSLIDTAKWLNKKGW